MFKSLIRIVTMVMFLSIFTASLLAQEKAEKMPEVAGGFSNLQKNIVYPDQAKKDGITGKVFVNAIINETGDVESAKVINSDEVDKLLSEAALKAVQKTKFIPAETNGKKVKSEITVPIVFALK